MAAFRYGISLLLLSIYNSDTFMDFIPKIGTLSLPVKKATRTIRFLI